MFKIKLYLRFLFILLLTVNCRVSYAQTKTAALIDKLKKAKAEKNYLTDTANVGLLTQLSLQYMYNNADSALYFAKQAVKLSAGEQYARGNAISLNCLGKAYYVLGNYSASLNAATNLMSISSKINYQPGEASAYLIMGLIYMSQDNYPESASNYNKSLVLFTRLKDEDEVAKVYFDLGICYDESDKSGKAFYYLDKAIEIANNVKDNTLISMTLNRMGEIYFHLNNYTMALSYYTRVVASQFTNNWERDFAWSGIAQCYYKLGQYQPAILSAQKSYRLAKVVNSAADAVRAQQILSESYAAINDYKDAYTWQSLFKKSNDSLFNSDKDKEENYLHLKQQQADNKQLENEIKTKEQAIAFSKRLLFFRNLIAVAFIVFLVIIIINNRQKTELNKILKKQNNDIALQKEEISKQKEDLDKLNNTKDQLFAVISHDLRSPFSAILQSLDAIRSGDISAGEQVELMEGFYLQVNLVTTMVNNLLVWAGSQQSGIQSHPANLDITAVVSDIVSISAFLAKNKNITIHHQHEAEKYVFADADHVKIIIQNLVGNAIKFTPEGGSIEIYYSEDEDCVAVHVKDTGVGISAEKMDKLFKITGKEISQYGTNNEAGAGIGLALIKQFTDANNGQLVVNSKPGEGSEFTVYLRKEY